MHAAALAWAGQWLGAGLTGALAVLAGWRCWRMRKALNAGPQGAWIAALNVAGCLLGCYFSGTAALPWLAPVIMVNYFLCDPRRAVLLNVPLVLVPIVLPGMLTSVGHAVSVIVVTVLTLALGLALSLRIQDDRVHLEELASLDALTGLPNRRMLERTLTRQIEERREYERLNGLIILDLDHFKDINDLYGHAAGDAALADLATILRFEVRDNDEVFRFGGEEIRGPVARRIPGRARTGHRTPAPRHPWRPARPRRQDHRVPGRGPCTPARLIGRTGSPAPTPPCTWPRTMGGTATGLPITSDRRRGLR